MKNDPSATGRSLHEYTIVIRPETNGTFVAHIPVISGCHA
jgi:predicted RNase H-like HicB family nuclease